jgi:hypothetical protein
VDPKLVNELKAKNGDDLHALSFGDVEMAFKRPSREVFRRFMVKVRKAREADDPSEELVYACLVYPEAGAAREQFDRMPGLITTFANGLIDLAGLAKECASSPL